MSREPRPGLSCSLSVDSFPGYLLRLYGLRQLHADGSTLCSERLTRMSGFLIHSCSRVPSKHLELNVLRATLGWAPGRFRPHLRKRDRHPPAYQAPKPRPPPPSRFPSDPSALRLSPRWLRPPLGPSSALRESVPLPHFRPSDGVHCIENASQRPHHHVQDTRPWVRSSAFSSPSGQPAVLGWTPPAPPVASAPSPLPLRPERSRPGPYAAPACPPARRCAGDTPSQRRSVPVHPSIRPSEAVT